ncbi:MAG: hypothetical protein PHQ59_04950 [Candidatus Daviesbacteria bacterium]|nr:hypothetical protein [Candidatus Daviesbacteria bacterium]
MPKEKGSVHILVLALLALGTLGLIGSSSITTTQKFSDSSQVLGENESIQKAAERAKEEAQKVAEQQKENNQASFQSERNKQETEIQTSNGQKIKTKVEDNGSVKVEIEQGKQKLKFQAEQKKSELEIEDEESTDSADEDLKEVRSISSFPLKISTSTGQLIMTKNGVERVLTVLPAKAIQNMLRAHLKNGLGPKFFEATPSSELISTASAEITVLNNQISLEEENGQAVYKIPMKKHLKLLGIIPVTTDLTSFVSAETGSVIKDQESLLSRFLGLLSR